MGIRIFKMNLLGHILSLILISKLVYSAELVPQKDQVIYEVTKDLTVACNIVDPEDDIQIQWLKDDKPVKDLITEKTKVEEKTNSTFTTVKIKGATASAAGKYKCVAMKNGSTIEGEIEVLSAVRVKTPKSINVVEGEKLKVLCDVIGSPPPVITWQLFNDSAADRAKFTTDEATKVPNTIFILEDIKPEDRGVYTCIGTRNETGEVSKHEILVRVKDKYAALWPFLGICAEVFVLCAIILVYEKKRNKNDLDESDTDQSPDQKNIPDQGKDSNLRHRQ